LFLGLLDPDPDPSVSGADPSLNPDPDPSIMKQKYYGKPPCLLFCDFFVVFLSLKNDVNLPSKCIT
jgi:hypothetical protein